MIYSNGAGYIGSWHDDKRYGDGVMRYKNSDKEMYDGKWVNDEKNGFAKMTYMNGDVYEGDWADDTRNEKEPRREFKYIMNGMAVKDFKIQQLTPKNYQITVINHGILVKNGSYGGCNAFMT